MKTLAVGLSSVLIVSLWSPAQAATRTATLSVPGMDCPACPITIKKALSKLGGVSDVKVSFEKRQATVTFDDAKVTSESLLQATRDAGYPSALEDPTK